MSAPAAWVAWRYQRVPALVHPTTLEALMRLGVFGKPKPKDAVRRSGWACQVCSAEGHIGACLPADLERVERSIAEWTAWATTPRA